MKCTVSFDWGQIRQFNVNDHSHAAWTSSVCLAPSGRRGGTGGRLSRVGEEEVGDGGGLIVTECRLRKKRWVIDQDPLVSQDTALPP